MPDVIVNLADVDYLNCRTSPSCSGRAAWPRAAGSSDLLRGDQVWGVILVTGLDKLFDFHDDLATAIASLVLEG